MTAPDRPRVRTEVHGAVILVLLDRAEKRNAFDLRMLRELSEAMTRYEADDTLRCAVLAAEGEHFTAGLDLAEVGPEVRAGAPLFPAQGIDPLGMRAPRRTKPLIMAVQGWCLTIGIELLLAADIRLAADDTRLGQIEINRGIFPFGGATVRLPAIAGWGNAMRWLLTGDVFDADEALRIGVVQEVTSPGALRARAMELAATVAKRAPLGVRATLESAATAENEGHRAAFDQLLPTAMRLMESEDAAEGLRSFVERRDGDFKGR
ncbi:MAG: crotonase/enoyl-CoA hydratase family protein [Nannocystaceae bacterium]|nr:crotonase/enoyl-CoA hydratase family protein [bacterium]